MDAATLGWAFGGLAFGIAVGLVIGVAIGRYRCRGGKAHAAERGKASLKPAVSFESGSSEGRRMSVSAVPSVIPGVDFDLEDLKRTSSSAIIMPHHVVTNFDGGVSRSPDNINDMVALMWPFVAKYVERLLREKVEPALQAALPKAFPSTCFTDKCHIGTSPVVLNKLLVEGHERQSSNLVQTTSVRLVGDAVLNADCEIELSIGAFKVGLRDLTLAGRLVVEFHQILETLPLIAGIRVYFVNPPTMEVTMTGAISRVLNTGIVKQKLLNVVSEQIGNLMVLPSSIAYPLADEACIDVFDLVSPRPEGVFRVLVTGVRGIFGEEECCEERPKVYVSMCCGNKVFRTPTKQTKQGEHSVCWQADNVVDFVVHDRHAQRLGVWLYVEVSGFSLTGLGASHGEIRGHCRIPVRAAQCGWLGKCWWPLKLDNSLDESGEDEDSDGDTLDMVRILSSVEDDDATMGKSPSTLTRLWDALGRLTAREPKVKVNGNTYVQLQTEWRPFLTGEEASDNFHDIVDISHDSLRHLSWNLARDPTTDDDVTCLLLVGVYAAKDLPSIKGEYFCTTSCAPLADEKIKTKTSSSVQGQRDSAGIFADRAGHTHHEVSHRLASTQCWDFFCNKTSKASKHHEYSVRGGDASFDEPIDEPIAMTVAARWDEPFVFKLHAPTVARATVDVHIDTGEEEHCLGSVKYDVRKLFSCNQLRDTYVGPLERLGYVPGHLRSAVPPEVKLVFQLWVLDRSDLNTMYKL